MLLLFEWCAGLLGEGAESDPKLVYWKEAQTLLCPQHMNPKDKFYVVVATAIVHTERTVFSRLQNYALFKYVNDIVIIQFIVICE